MNKEVLRNKEVSDALHCLFHCARKDINYETQYQQFRLVYDYIKKLEEENKKLNEEIQHIKNDNMRLATSKNVRYTYGLR